MNKGIDVVEGEADWIAPEDNALLPITPATRMQPPLEVTKDPEKLKAWLEWRRRFEDEWRDAIRQEQRKGW